MISEKVLNAIRDELGVAVGEEFNILDKSGCYIDDNPYKFTEKHLKNCHGDIVNADISNDYRIDNVLGKLIFKFFTIEKIPFQFNSVYYTINMNKKSKPYRSYWRGTVTDWLLYHNDLVFENREDAEKEINKGTFIGFKSFNWKKRNQNVTNHYFIDGTIKKEIVECEESDYDIDYKPIEIAYYEQKMNCIEEFNEKGLTETCDFELFNDLCSYFQERQIGFTTKVEPFDHKYIFINTKKKKVIIKRGEAIWK